MAMGRARGRVAGMDRPIFKTPKREQHTMVAVQLELWAQESTTSESGPSESGPSELGPSELGPSELGPSELGPSELGPSESAGSESAGRKTLGRPPAVAKPKPSKPKLAKGADSTAEKPSITKRRQKFALPKQSFDIRELATPRKTSLNHSAEAPNGSPEDRELTALDRLRRQVAVLETGGKNDGGQRISCGVGALDQMLPGNGMAPGTIVEWVENDPASGAGWLSLLAARAALVSRAGLNAEPNAAAAATSRKFSPPAAGGRLVVIDIDSSFYPLSAAAAGIPLDRIIVVRPSNLADGLWAADQALRNPAVSAVWGRLPTLDDRQARRLQLAAETGRTMGFWLRPGRALSEPSWAEVRWFIRGLEAGSEPEHSSVLSQTGISSRYLEARLVRCRGGRSGTSVTLEIDSSGKVLHVPSKRKTAAVPLVAQLADPTTATRIAAPQRSASQAREKRSA